ncbi:hypothetical protein LAG90_06915 [Marinilongibacter aquaticus]|uniref:hypothetical protein n=1 Tax=Marinilongibacter aquaticus TaxID=2975157 RepID=UPI0021BD5FF5|nr:hypothetical protein [Marinilongibacter aquaticus]UBM60375.1 hypothetical protein LAG90_06915 [Marinilongibacter aquaticus]
MAFDFKKYHVRAMNAASEAEKAEINKELKAYYASLPDDEKKAFNEELQSFLIKEMAAIKSVYDGVKSGESEN